MSLGAHFIHAKAERLLVSDDHIAGVELSTGRELTAGAVVNAAGAWAAEIARSGGVDLPITPTKRQVTVIETTLQPEGLLPPIFFPSGLYCIHEGENHFTCALSRADDPVGYDDLRWERERFEDRIWRELIAVIPSFDRLRISGGWAGLYAVNTFDGNAILGE